MIINKRFPSLYKIVNSPESGSSIATVANTIIYTVALTLAIIIGTIIAACLLGSGVFFLVAIIFSIAYLAARMLYKWCYKSKRGGE